MTTFFPSPELFFSHLGITEDDLRKGKTVEIDGAILAQLISQALISAPISTDDYLKYDDISTAWQKRDINDLQAHYAQKGFFEQRPALPEAFDAQWYAKTFPDVQLAIDNGELHSAAEHYLDQGYREWRAPCASLRYAVQKWKQLIGG